MKKYKFKKGDIVQIRKTTNLPQFLGKEAVIIGPIENLARDAKSNKLISSAPAYYISIDGHNVGPTGHPLGIYENQLALPRLSVPVDLDLT